VHRADERHDDYHDVDMNTEHTGFPKRIDLAEGKTERAVLVEERGQA